ncbi:MAG: cyclase family protein [Hyphomicrobiaceae bacterium]
MRRAIQGLVVLLAATATCAEAQTWQAPPENQRCPSKWGADDERGAANHIKPETVLKAARLIKTGEIIELGHKLAPNMPFFGTRRFDVHMKRTFTPPTAGNTSARSGNEEIVITELGHVGTQFDAFPHQTIGDSLYNCVKNSDTAGRGGFAKLGVDKVGGIFTRGVLIDVAAYKGVEMLGDNYEITVDDLKGALTKQKMTLQPGDAVIIHTGWGKLWAKDNARFVKSCPGIGVPAALWLAEQDPVLLGSDNWPVEVSPNPDPKLNLPVHQIALVVKGIFLLENMKLDELAAKGAFEFALSLQPLKIQGGTGSTVAPVAIR